MLKWHRAVSVDALLSLGLSPGPGRHLTWRFISDPEQVPTEKEDKIRV